MALDKHLSGAIYCYSLVTIILRTWKYQPIAKTRQSSDERGRNNWFTSCLRWPLLYKKVANEVICSKLALTRSKKTETKRPISILQITNYRHTRSFPLNLQAEMLRKEKERYNTNQAQDFCNCFELQVLAILRYISRCISKTAILPF